MSIDKRSAPGPGGMHGGERQRQARSAAHSAADQRFPRRNRIRHRNDFDRVYEADVYAADQTLVVRGSPNGLGFSRLGLSVSRKVGNAVVRNRWKRLIREAFRKSGPRLPTGFDFVVRPRRGAQPTCAAIAESLPRLAGRVAKRYSRDAP
jgi:ribonuclease P protein component